MSSIWIDISQIGPELIGHRLETTDENGHRVGIRLARYEVLDDVGGEILYCLYSDPAPVTVKVRPGAQVLIAASAAGSRPAPPSFGRGDGPDLGDDTRAGAYSAGQPARS